jgi:hypothetical protein
MRNGFIISDSLIVAQNVMTALTLMKTTTLLYRRTTTCETSYGRHDAEAVALFVSRAGSNCRPVSVTIGRNHTN